MTQVCVKERMNNVQSSAFLRRLSNLTPGRLCNKTTVSGLKTTKIHFIAPAQAKESSILLTEKTNSKDS